MPFHMLRTTLRALTRDRRGNVAILSALALPVLIGAMGIGAEVASWYGGKRGLQNAADSAAIAAATNATDDSYDDEARAVASQYGFQNDVGGTTVTAENNQPCPDGEADCYRVTISKLQPVYLAQVVGFKGDVEVDGVAYKRLTSTALAKTGEGPRLYCILTLATSGDPQALRSNGSPFADLSGCNVMSNTSAKCDGFDLKADIGDAAGTNDGCGKKKNSNVEKVEDPYAELAKNIPKVDDTDCQKAPTKKGDPALTSKNKMSGPMTADKLVCGDIQLNGPVLVTEPNTLLVIKDGSLDLKGNTFMTQPGASLTIIFTGTDPTRTHAPIGNGKFDYAAPDKDSGSPWSGIAMYQDPATKQGVNITEAGNQPTWNITGLVYLPNASVTLSGAVSKASGGKSCFALVVDNLTINGTGSILNHGECKDAGLALPEGKGPSRGELVS